MKYSIKTENALMSLAFIAKKRTNTPVSIKEIAENGQYTIPFIEKIFQKLRKAGIVKSELGKTGGYVLNYSPSKISIKQVIEALESNTFAIVCDSKKEKKICCSLEKICGLKKVWKGTRKLLDTFYGSITLADLAGNKKISLPKIMES
jgi:Rrf2 family iron-sulfur cluster assembly transcriptional regulator